MTDTGFGSERHSFCTSCGAEAVTGGSFCTECGQSLIKTTEQGVSTDTQHTDVATANRTQVSGEVSPVRKSRKWLWPVGVAAVLLVAAGVIFGLSSGNSGTTARGESAAVALGHQLYHENADVGVAENTCTNQAGEQGAMSVTEFVNDCIDAYVNGGGNSGATGASGNTGDTTTTTTPPTTTSTTAAISTSGLPPQEAQFVNDMWAAFPGMQSRMANFFGQYAYTVQKLVTLAESVCTSMQVHAVDGYSPLNPENSDYSQAEAVLGAGGIPVVTEGNYSQEPQHLELMMSIVIKDLCPSYLNLIPPGYPGT